MKPVSAKTTKGVGVGSRVKCIDNTGAKELKIIAIKGSRSRKRRQPKAGIGDVVVCSVTSGDPKIRNETPLAVVVRQKKEWRRSDGRRVKFDDNAVILVNERYDPRGSEIKGAVAKEVIQRFSSIGKIASVIV